MKKAGPALTTVITAAICLILLTSAALAGPGEVPFAADILITSGQSTTKARLFVKNQHVRRVEMGPEAGGMIFICPENARGKIWMLNPDQKQYRILSWPAIHRDPVQAWTDIQYDMAGARAGRETINGHPCTVYVYKYPGRDKVALKLWLAEDLNYPIRKEADAKIMIEKDTKPEIISGTFQILNIRTGLQDESLFRIPADYKEKK